MTTMNSYVWRAAQETAWKVEHALGLNAVYKVLSELTSY